jgi:hypothetical protein
MGQKTDDSRRKLVCGPFDMDVFLGVIINAAFPVCWIRLAFGETTFR